MATRDILDLILGAGSGPLGNLGCRPISEGEEVGEKVMLARRPLSAILESMCRNSGVPGLDCILARTVGLARTEFVDVTLGDGRGNGLTGERGRGVELILYLLELAVVVVESASSALLGVRETTLAVFLTIVAELLTLAFGRKEGDAAGGT